jgi:ATPase subunit of ABC transporter with duplicated ATPase domains
VLEAFEEAVRAFAGPVVIVAYDRRLAARFGGDELRLEGGRGTPRQRSSERIPFRA